MNSTITVSRTSLSLSPLQIFDGCGEDVIYWITYNNLARPDFDIKRTYIPDSAWVPGKRLQTAGQEPSSLRLQLIVNGISHADLSAKMEELEQATFQLAYTVSLDIDGQTKTWDADSSLPQWGLVEHLLQDHFQARGTLEIPIYC